MFPNSHLTYLPSVSFEPTGSKELFGVFSTKKIRSGENLYLNYWDFYNPETLKERGIEYEAEAEDPFLLTRSESNKLTENEGMIGKLAGKELIHPRYFKESSQIRAQLLEDQLSMLTSDGQQN